MIPALLSLFLGLLLGYRWGKEDGRGSAAGRPEGGSVRAALLDQAHQHMVSAQIEQIMGTASTDRDELEDRI